MKWQARGFWSLVLALSLTWSIGTGSAQSTSIEAKLNPVQVPGVTWAFDGFSVTMPKDSGWHSLGKDAKYADLAKDFSPEVQAALVIEARELEQETAKQAQLLDRVRAEFAATAEKGMELLDYSAEPYSPKGALCARFSAKFDDRRNEFPKPGTMLVRGLACVPPNQPKAVVTVRYAQRAARDEILPALSDSAEAVLASLRFPPDNSPVLNQARQAVRSEKPQEAADLLQPLVEAGDSEAALFLGTMYLYGRGVTPDYSKARRWLEIASREGHVDALYNLGAMCDKAIGGERDVQQALHWFTLAADQRDPQAQLNLALLYMKGDGVPRDNEAGLEWLRRAAGNGSKRAQGLLDLATRGKP
jgi:TPR repeat protein